jgi:hypothetical protein
MRTAYFEFATSKRQRAFARSWWRMRRWRRFIALRMSRLDALPGDSGWVDQHTGRRTFETIRTFGQALKLIASPKPRSGARAKEVLYSARARRITAFSIASLEPNETPWCPLGQSCPQNPQRGQGGINTINRRQIDASHPDVAAFQQRCRDLGGAPRPFGLQDPDWVRPFPRAMVSKPAL